MPPARAGEEQAPHAAVPIALAAAGGALGLGSIAVALVSVSFARAAFARASYAVLVLLAVVWARELALGVDAEAARRWLRRHRGVLVAAAAITALIFLTVPVGFEVLDDETELFRTSMAMTAGHDLSAPVTAVHRLGRLVPIQVDLPWRPLLFPFVVHVAHALSTTRPENAFAVNAAAFLALLVVVAAGARARLGTAAALSAMVLVASVPVITATATSGGFDTLALTLAVLTLVLAWRLPAAERALGPVPGGAGADAALRLFWVHGLLLCHLRYEGVLVFGTIAVVALATGRIVPGHVRRHVDLVALTPLLVAPWIWQRLALGTTDQAAASFSSGTFSLDYVPRNLAAWRAMLVELGTSQPYPVLLNQVGVAIGVALSLPSMRRRWSGDPTVRFAVASSAAVLGLLTALFTLHFRGDCTVATSARFYLPLALALALLPLGLFVIVPRPRAVAAVAAVAAIAFVVYHPVAVESRQLGALVYGRTLDWTRAALAGREPSRTLVVSTMPGSFLPFGFGSVGFDQVALDPGLAERALAARDADDVAVVQMVELSGGDAVRGTALGPPWELETLLERRLSEDLALRVSLAHPARPR